MFLDRKRVRRRQRQLDAAVAAIQGRYGPWTLVKGGRATAGTIEPGAVVPVPHIPTGFLALDRALSIGGLPKGRVCEVMGPATSGKTTLAIKFLAQAQKSGSWRGDQVGYIDQALYFDPDYAHRCGLDLSRLLVVATHDLQEALVTMESLLHSGGLSALVLDTLDFLWTEPQSASFLDATLNRLSAPLSRSGAILLVLHESPDDHSPALSALAHCAAVRLRVTREDWVRHHGDVRGYKARVEVLKNKTGPACRAASITIEFNDTVQGSDL